MASRPVFIPKLTAPYYYVWNGEFQWNRGMAPSQKKKNITALHQSFTDTYPDKKALEISSKSMQEGGVSLSAFFLPKFVPSINKSVPVENVYQAGKVFSGGGPYTDLLELTPRAAKGDERLKTSGRLIGFRFEDMDFPTNPPHAFYDYLYINALMENEDLTKVILNYDGFTDIEFNPQNSISCQARAAAIFVALHHLGLLDKIKNPDDFMELFKVKPIVPTGATPAAVTTKPQNPAAPAKPAVNIKNGDTIIHSVWGNGTVIAVEDSTITVSFASVGDKKLGTSWVIEKCKVEHQ